jgi:hypothetical protein
LKHHDASNIEYHKLIALRDIILRNPTSTLQAIDQEVEKALNAHNTNISEVSTVLSMVKNIDESTFPHFLEEAEKNL